MGILFRIDMNGIPFSSPSLALNNSEISKVCHEISTNFSKYIGKGLIIHRTRDLDGNWCIYYVESHGYGDYNIIEKYYD